jgi:hypothetical protein
VNLKEKDGWLFVLLEAAEQDPDLDWNGLVTWKIPESERIYVPEIDAWIVRGKHRRLVEDLFFIYRELGQADPESKALNRVQQMLEKLDRGEPRREELSERIQEAERNRREGQCSKWEGMYEADPN